MNSGVRNTHAERRQHRQAVERRDVGAVEYDPDTVWLVVQPEHRSTSEDLSQFLQKLIPGAVRPAHRDIQQRQQEGIIQPRIGDRGEVQVAVERQQLLESAPVQQRHAGLVGSSGTIQHRLTARQHQVAVDEGVVHPDAARGQPVDGLGRHGSFHDLHAQLVVADRQLQKTSRRLDHRLQFRLIVDFHDRLPGRLGQQRPVQRDGDLATDYVDKILDELRCSRLVRVGGPRFRKPGVKDGLQLLRVRQDERARKRRVGREELQRAHRSRLVEQRDPVRVVVVEAYFQSRQGQFFV